MLEVYVDGSMCEATSCGGIGLATAIHCEKRSLTDISSSYEIEIRAIIQGLRFLQSSCGIIYTDAQSVVEHARKVIPKWKKYGFPVDTNMRFYDLWLDIFVLLTNGARLQYIAKAANHPLHVKAHQAAKEALDNARPQSHYEKQKKSVRIGVYLSNLAPIGVTAIINKPFQHIKVFYNIKGMRLRLMSVYTALEIIHGKNIDVIKMHGLILSKNSMAMRPNGDKMGFLKRKGIGICGI